MIHRKYRRINRWWNHRAGFVWNSLDYDPLGGAGKKTL